MRYALLFALSLSSALATASSQAIVGNVRVQFLSRTLVRIEEKGPLGWEDRPTFRVVERKWAGAKFTRQGVGKSVLLRQGRTIVKIDRTTAGIKGVAVMLDDNRKLFDGSGGLPENRFLPGPSSLPAGFVMVDNPRLIPPTWGATPAPPNVDPALKDTSGWDTRNNAGDVYVFLTGNGYGAFRREFLRLTGPIPLPPLFAFGFIDSRYHEYTEQEALDSIDAYRKRQIPLDTFVVDTDWRIGGSHGYDPDPKYFPDMPRFIKAAHARNVRLMFNDHPDPISPNALDPVEAQARWDGLTKLLGWGMDVWWYDRNWMTHLGQPMPGIRTEVWGQAVYHDVTQRFRPEERPFIMSNVQGIDNGLLHYPPDPASHRYPIMWTGDTHSVFEYLQHGVENGVNEGVVGLLPYVHEDLGGHYGGPTPELYVRYLEYGCLSPITRVHCTRGEDRHPWAFGPEAERIVTDYIKLRYRLLPTIYSAARRAYDDGTPLLRRLDLEWPDSPEAASPDEYLLGDDILVAPIIHSIHPDPSLVPAELFHTPDGQPGLKAEYWSNPDLQGAPTVSRIDKMLDFDWGAGSPDPAIPADHFSARWAGTVGPMPASGEYIFQTTADDGVRVFVDGKLAIDEWHPSDSEHHQAKLNFEKGKSYDIKVEYFEGEGDADLHLAWIPAGHVDQPVVAQRQAWIPPGEWQDAWTGERQIGPKTVRVDSPLWHTPMWVRAGGLVFLAPPLQRTWDKPLDRMTIEAYVPSGPGRTERNLYEDDGISVHYDRLFALTKALLSVGSNAAVSLVLQPAKGAYASKLSARDWTVRIHLPAVRRPRSLTVDGQAVSLDHRPTNSISATVLQPAAGQTMPFAGAGTAAGSTEGAILEIHLPKRPPTRRTTILLTTGRN